MTTYRISITGTSHFNGELTSRVMTIEAMSQSGAEEIATIRSMSYLTVETITTSILTKEEV